MVSHCCCTWHTVPLGRQQTSLNSRRCGFVVSALGRTLKTRAFYLQLRSSLHDFFLCYCLLPVVRKNCSDLLQAVLITKKQSKRMWCYWCNGSIGVCQSCGSSRCFKEIKEIKYTLCNCFITFAFSCSIPSPKTNQVGPDKNPYHVWGVFLPFKNNDFPNTVLWHPSGLLQLIYVRVWHVGFQGPLHDRSPAAGASVTTGSQ